MKTVFITGGTKGIGLACCKKFEEAGYKVVSLYSKDDAAAERAKSLLKRVTYYKADVSCEEKIRQIFESLPSLDVLVNSAGVSHFSQVQDCSLSDWERLFAVNVRGVFLCTREAVKKFLKHGSGAIVNIASIWGETGGSCESAYSATKGAIIAFTKAVAKELAPSRIPVNCISPGAIETEMNARLSKEEKESLLSQIPMGRFGLPEEVAELALFLSEQKYLTGQDIAINGGWYC